MKMRRIGENIFKKRKEYSKMLLVAASKCVGLWFFFFFLRLLLLPWLLYSMSFKYEVGAKKTYGLKYPNQKERGSDVIGWGAVVPN